MIAEISGYAEYLESTELAHAQGIISRLLETLIHRRVTFNKEVAKLSCCAT